MSDLGPALTIAIPGAALFLAIAVLGVAQINAEARVRIARIQAAEAPRPTGGGAAEGE